MRELLIFATLLFGWTAPAQAKSCSQIYSLHLPVVAQTTDFTCGVACFDSILRYWRGASPGEIPLAYALGTMLNGRTDSAAIVLAARTLRLNALEQAGGTIAQLLDYLSRGETLYVGWILEGTGHYSLVNGIGAKEIELMDPWFAREHPGEYNTLTFEQFIPAWNNGTTLFGQIIRISPWPLLP